MAASGLRRPRRFGSRLGALALGIAAVVSAPGVTALGAAPGSSASTSGSAWRSRVIDLGTLDWDYSYATAINYRGQVAGRNVASVTGQSHAFRWTTFGGMRFLGTLPTLSSDSEAVAINASGQVTGISGHAFRWTPSDGMQDLGTLGGTYSSGAMINDRGQVTGTADTARHSHAFRWTSSGGMRDLGRLGGTDSSAVAINDRGQVTGYATTATGETHAFWWTPSGGMQDLGTLGRTYRDYYPTGINDHGEVVGDAWTLTFPYHEHAFRWTRSGGMEDLGTLGGRNSSAAAINDRGQIIGSADTKAGQTHATLWLA
jgi:probable HAF family extracellular repeat protein